MKTTNQSKSQVAYAIHDGEVMSAQPIARLVFDPKRDYLLGWQAGAFDVGKRHLSAMSVLGLLCHCDRVLAEAGCAQPYVEGLRDAYVTALEG